MISRAAISLLLGGATVLTLYAGIGIAEEIGTTPDGNVIYKFECPGLIRPKDIDTKVDWPNHMGTHPEWDIESGFGTTGIGIFSTDGEARYHSKGRNGQVLKCFYHAKVVGRPAGSFYYRYKVRRDIISCQNLYRGWKCVLKADGGGGQAGSSATSSSQSSSDAPPGTVPDVILPTVHGIEPCCNMAANASLKGRLGRILFSFPGDKNDTSVVVLKNGKEVKSGYGNQRWDLLPGAYDVRISGKTVSNVSIQSGYDTTVKAGVLRVSAEKHTRLEIMDGEKILISRYGTQLVGLPPGPFQVKVGEETQTVTINHGQVTDF